VGGVQPVVVVSPLAGKEIHPLDRLALEPGGGEQPPPLRARDEGFACVISHLTSRGRT